MTAPLRILVADDNPGMARTVAMILGREGYRVDTAADGHTALQRVREEEYDAVLLDVRMPRMNGLEVVEEMRRAAPRTAVLLMTAYPPEEVAEAARAAGVRRIWSKPLPLDDLLAELAGLRPESKANRR